MIEIYWLTRVSVIGSACKLVAILGFILLVVMLMLLPIIYQFLEDLEEGVRKKYKKCFCVAVFVWFVCILGAIFVPTQKEMLLIYGLGSTVDYVKSNDKANQLPDKAVEALTRYLDSMEKEEKDD